MQNCFVVSANALERIGMERIVTDMGWNLHNLEDEPMPEDSIGIVGVDFQNIVANRLSDHLKEYSDYRIALFCTGDFPDTGLEIPEFVSAVLGLNFDVPEICAALKLVEAGHCLLPREVSELTRANQTNKCEAWNLTKREVQVSEVLAKGFTNKEIGLALGITTNTVDVHVSSIRRKLGVQNRTQIATTLINSGEIG